MVLLSEQNPGKFSHVSTLPGVPGSGKLEVTLGEQSQP